MKLSFRVIALNNRKRSVPTARFTRGWRIARMNAREVKLKYETLRKLNRGASY